MFDSLKLRKRVLELEEEMLKLTRIIQSHDLEWSDMRARCKRLLDRTEKAAKRMETEEEPELSAAPEVEVAGESGSPALLLSPAQQRLQQQILRQRQARKIA